MEGETDGRRGGDGRMKGIAEAYPGIWIKEGRLRRICTRNLTPGKQFFEFEETLEPGGEYRVLDPRRSKLGAAIAKGLQQTGMRPGNTILYLGASHGYTPSYVSDIVGKDGFVFCLDFAPRVVRDLVFVCEARQNMAPLLGDAKQPESYAEHLPAEGVDAVYQDIAQREQVEIFLKNCDRFLKRGGFGILAVKARSVDVTRHPREIFRDIKRTLERRQELVIVDYRELDPFEKDHALFVVKKR